MSDETESSSDASDTYAQIVVPTYDLENPITTSANGGTTTGSSFVRLGSFPSLTDTTEQPSGFAKSLALAQLVAGTNTSCGTTYTTTALAEDAGPSSSYDLLTTDAYTGDTSLFLGFADDTRSRDGAIEAAGTVDSTHTATDDLYIDWTFVSNTVDNRQAETARLLFKGGWWDHSDGNRITTTCGDKVEVIQGNYKMIVLGRQQPSQGSSVLSGNAVVTDLSGGQALESCYTPGAGAVAIEYVESDGVWTAYESGSGNAVSTYTGNQESYTYGEVYNTFVGWDPSGADNNYGSEPTEAQKYPSMTSKTWASTMETYIGSGGKPVPYMYSYTAATTMSSDTEATTMLSTTSATTMSSTTTAKDMYAYTQVNANNSVTVGAEITSTTVAALIASTSVGINLAVSGPSTVDINFGPTLFLYGGPVQTIGIDEEEVFATGEELKAVKTELLGLHTQLSDDHTAVSAAVTSLSADFTNMAGVVTVIADEVGYI